MSAEIKNQKRHFILVRKTKKVGIERYDEYIKKSGLEAKEYQREGVEFCLRRERELETKMEGGKGNVRGGIIADEMGLGKTIMMMGLIIANLEAYRRTLIVVPVALIAQWVAQLKQTIIDTGVKPDLSVVVFHGSAGKRSVILAEGEGGGDGMVWWRRPPKKASVGGGSGGRVIDIVITTYGCVAMEEPVNVTKNKKNDDSSSIKRITTNNIQTLSLLTFRADRVIFDEAHHLRNKTSRVFKGAMRVTRPSLSNVQFPSVWIVTGTPIQNKISDLKSLCYILGLGVNELMTEEQRKAIREQYVLRRTKVSVGMVAVGTGTEGSVCAPRLQSLRHYKTQVPWGSENELALSRDIHCKARNTTDRSERLKLYTRMRQMCVCPALIDDGEKTATATAGDDATGHAVYGLSKEEYNIAVSKQSKLDRVVATIVAEMAAATGTERKSLVFCHYRREMTRLREMLLREGGDGGDGGDGGGGGYSEQDIAIIDGRVTGRERERILAAVPKVLILQIRTCSEGLNLQSYSDVYFVSPHWNPCVEDQAIARCYRMGQTKGVRVFRFYMSDFVVDEVDSVSEEKEASAMECISTLDHKCEEIQERKRVLCNEFLCGV